MEDNLKPQKSKLPVLLTILGIGILGMIYVNTPLKINFAGPELIVALVLFVGVPLLIRFTPAHIRKPFGGILITIGAFLVIFAIVRMNSAAAQLSQAFGSGDAVSALSLLGGIPCALIGVWMFFSGRSAAPAQPQALSGAPASSDTLSQLERLAQLRDSGALSPSEFEAQKKRLLG